MHRFASIVPLLSLLTCACGAPAPRASTPLDRPASCVPAESEAAGDSLPAVAEASGETACLDLVFSVSGHRIEVSVTARDGELGRWTASAFARDLSARDANGPLALVLSTDSVTFDRPVEPPLLLDYQLVSGLDDVVSLSEPLRFDGRALVLPTSDSPCPLRIVTRGVDPEQVASTLGLGATQTLLARPVDLRDVTWAMGPIEHAIFEAREGHDVIASLGTRSYDVRWVGAELALVRSRVDGYFGGIDAEPHTTLLISTTSAPGVLPFVAARSGIGLRVLVRSDAHWDAEARLAVTQVLVRRWLGGVLRFVDDAQVEQTWASFGISRWVAQEILLDMGTLTAAERAADLTRLEAAIALSEAPSLATAMARGTLYAGALDARLRAGGGTLRGLLLELLGLAEDAQGVAQPRAVFEDALRAQLGEEEVARFTAQVLQSDALEVPRGAFGPCVRRGGASHRRFSLGIVAEAEADGSVIVRSVETDHRAHGAGVREGMRGRALTYAEGEPSVPARLILASDPERTIEWLPFDREVRGTGWDRVPRVAEERCGDR